MISGCKKYAGNNPPRGQHYSCLLTRQLADKLALTVGRIYSRSGKYNRQQPQPAAGYKSQCTFLEEDLSSVKIFNVFLADSTRAKYALSNSCWR
jgi:hypothetical protein